MVSSLSNGTHKLWPSGSQNTSLPGKDAAMDSFVSKRYATPVVPSRTMTLTSTTQVSQKESMYVEFSNADGDTVKLSYARSLEYAQTVNQTSTDDAGLSLSQKDQKAIVDKMIDEYKNMKHYLMALIADSLDGKKDTTKDVNPQESTQPTETADVTAGLPEYWNAENTSQRIVDFALQFAGQGKGNSAEFIKTMKDAIEKGFGQASAILGSVSSQTAKLTQDTHDLVMKKLDSWLSAQSGSDQIQAAA